MNAQDKTSEQPCVMRKRIERLQTSRDNLRIKYREQSSTIKKLNDSNFELKESRRKWREKSERLFFETQQLRENMKQVQTQSEQERQISSQLRLELENLKKKQ